MSSSSEQLSHDDISRIRVVMLRLVRNIRAKSVGDLTPSQTAMLAALVNHGPSTVGQLAEYEHVQPPSASRIIAALEQQGFVERIPNPDDRRCTTIALTASATAHIEEARAVGTTWLAQRIERLSPAEAQVLREATPILERLLEADV